MCVCLCLCLCLSIARPSIKCPRRTPPLQPSTTSRATARRRPTSRLYRYKRTYMYIHIWIQIDRSIEIHVNILVLSFFLILMSTSPAAFHHIENHLEKTPNEYIRWRYEHGSDKEVSANDRAGLVITIVPGSDKELLG